MVGGEGKFANLKKQAIAIMIFFPGLDDIYNAHHVERCMISIHRLSKRKSGFKVAEWILDSGAFTSVTKNGGYGTESLPKYADHIMRWASNGNLLASVSQDYMCEQFILDKTGMTIAEHQRLTIYRYKALRKMVPENIYIMPVLQGYAPSDYTNHLRQYGNLLQLNQWVGVGSVCKRNSNVGSVEAVLVAIAKERPDLKLHGFGVKLTALKSSIVQNLLHSSDSMAWSFAARYEGRKPHDIQECIRYTQKVLTCPIQMNLFS